MAALVSTIKVSEPSGSNRLRPPWIPAACRCAQAPHLWMVRRQRTGADKFILMRTSSETGAAMPNLCRNRIIHGADPDGPFSSSVRSIRKQHGAVGNVIPLAVNQRRQIFPP